MASTYEISAEGIRVEHSIKLTKLSERQLNDGRVARQIDTILAGVNNAARTKRGWKIEADRPRQDYNYDSSATGEYITTVELSVVCLPEKPRDSLDVEFQNILNSIASLGTVPKWKVTHVDDNAYTVKAPDQLEEGLANQVGYAPIVLPDDPEWLQYFNHLYGLDSQINRIRRALDAAVISDWRNRFHCVLIGPPGCGKSDMCQSIKTALGEESVLEFDATSTSMAGAQKELAEREELPRVLLVEEIEKAEASMSWLLSVLDLRAEIRKTTARGNILKDTKMLCIATVNDYPTFVKAQFGALDSRFSNKIFVQRPPRQLLERIIKREINRIEGDDAWIGPTLDYADKHDVSDPRTLVAIALCGREQLITGKYQTDLENTKQIGWEAS